MKLVSPCCNTGEGTLNMRQGLSGRTLAQILDVLISMPYMVFVSEHLSSWLQSPHNIMLRHVSVP